MSSSAAITEREIKMASVLRPLGHGPLTREQALLAAQILGSTGLMFTVYVGGFWPARSRVLWRYTR
jgi:hypothetical protein